MTPSTLLPLDDAGLSRWYGDPPAGVRANMVMSLDGATDVGGHTTRLSDDTDQLVLAHLRSHADVVLVGAGTVRAERYTGLGITDEQQRRRVALGMAPTPALAIVTASASLAPDDPVFGATDRVLVLTTAARSVAVTGLADVAEVVAAGEDSVEPERVVSALVDRGLPRILCEGGPTLLAGLTDAGLVEEVCLSLSPVLTAARRELGVGSAPAVAEHLVPRHVLHRGGMLYLRYSRPSSSDTGLTAGTRT